MAASLTVTRVSVINADNKPQTTYMVTASVEIKSEVFVHTVDDRGATYDKYFSVASLYDSENLPTSRVGGASRYLKTTAVIVYEGIKEASFAQDQITLSLKTLVSEYNTYKTKFEKNDTLEIT